MTREKTRRSFLKTDSIQTSTNTARKIASAVGTVITKATWSSMFWKRTAEKNKTETHMYRQFNSGAEVDNLIKNIQETGFT